MTHPVTKQQVMKLVGKNITAVKKDGTRITGKLIRVSGNRLVVQRSVKGRKVQTKALIPLVLFDLLAIGTAPYAFGGGYGPGYGPGPGYPPGYGQVPPGYGAPYGPGFYPGFF